MDKKTDYYNLKNIPHSPFEFLQKKLQETRKETKDRVGVKYYTWSEWYNQWIDVIQPILDTIPKAKQQDSLLIFRLMEFNKSLLFIQEMVFISGYHQAIREMRFIFESTLQAFYVDTNYSNYALNEKIEMVDEFWGRKKLIKKLSFNENIINRLNWFYDDLSKRVHPSKNEMKDGIDSASWRFTFAYNEEMFNDCVEFTNNIWDVIIFVTLKEFPFLIEELKKDVFSRDWLRDTKCELTLNLLNS